MSRNNRSINQNPHLEKLAKLKERWESLDFTKSNHTPKELELMFKGEQWMEELEAKATEWDSKHGLSEELKEDCVGSKEKNIKKYNEMFLMLGMDQLTVARLLGISRTTLQKRLGGGCKIGKEMFLAMFQLLTQKPLFQKMVDTLGGYWEPEEDKENRAALLKQKGLAYEGDKEFNPSVNLGFEEEIKLLNKEGE